MTVASRISRPPPFLVLGFGLLGITLFGIGCGSSSAESVQTEPLASATEVVVAPEATSPTTAPAPPTTIPVPAPTLTPTASEPTPDAAPEATTPPPRIPSPTPDAELAQQRAAAQCQIETAEVGLAGTVAIAAETVVDGLEVPWGLAMLPSGDMLVTERPGRLRLIRDGVLVEEPILEIQVSDPDPLFGIDRLGFEGGMLDVLLHPDFETNRLFYLFVNVATADGRDIGRLLRYALADDGSSASVDRVILDEIPTGLHHQGGRMKIGPDGMLYVGIGAFDPTEAQNPDTVAGKLLRLDLDGGIPGDNPDPSSFVYVSGIRNTQGFDWFDGDRIVVVDHGPSGLELDMPDLAGFDEVNVVTAGDNLGWPRVWGCANESDLIAPILTWATSVPPTGAVLYRGDAIPAWTDSFLFTTVGRATTGHHLHRVVLDPSNPYRVVSHEVYLAQQFGRLRTIVEAPDGSLYVMTSNCDARGACPPQGDVIVRITAG